MSDRLILRTPAKVNLFLKIKGKRSDGYHDIVTVMQMVDLCDELIIEQSDTLEVICSGNETLSGQENLIYKAALRLKEYSGIKTGAGITLNKVIPVGAGLGGGSSDAAAALIGLNKLWETGLSNERLIKIGKEIGSDVPFFFKGPSAIGFGRGDELVSLCWSADCWFLLVNPGIYVSTAWAYSQVSLFHSPDSRHESLLSSDIWLGPFTKSKFELTNEDEGIKIPMPKGLRKKGDEFWLSPCNDFEEVITKKYPSIKIIKETMLASGAMCSLMSGSGPTVFGIFGERSSAERACILLQDNGWKSWVVKSLHCPPYS